jgi:hypothetical protein
VAVHFDRDRDPDPDPDHDRDRDPDPDPDHDPDRDHDRDPDHDRDRDRDPDPDPDHDRDRDPDPDRDHDRDSDPDPDRDPDRDSQSVLMLACIGVIYFVSFGTLFSQGKASTIAVLFIIIGPTYSTSLKVPFERQSLKRPESATHDASLKIRKSPWISFKIPI